MEPTTVHPDLPAEVVAWEEAGRVALAAAAHAESWTTLQRQEVLLAAERVTGVLTALKGRVLTAEQDAGTWELSGERDLAAWAGRVTKQGRGGGFAQVGQAATLAAMPVVAEALVDGPVTAGHLAQLTRATTSSPTLATHLAGPEGQAKIVTMAQQLDAGSFGKALAEQAARLDPASRQRTQDQQRATRYLTLTHGPGGTSLRGQMDSVAGNIMQRALDALCPQPSVEDDRSRGQHQIDALTTMAQQVLADKTTTPGSVAPPQVLLLLREETWAALRQPRGEDAGSEAGQQPGTADGAGSPQGRRPQPGPGSTRDVITRLTGVPPITDEDGNIWPASEVARILCDCDVTRMVLDAQDVPINEGRGKRLFTPAQRKAMIARDGGGCAIPGCSIPARYTQLHHITWWSRHGHSNLVDGMQACDHHHHYIHDHDIHISRNSRGEYVFQFPDGRLMPGSTEPDPPGLAEPCPPADPEAELCPADVVGLEAEPCPPDDSGGRDPAPPPPDEQLLLWTA